MTTSGSEIGARLKAVRSRINAAASRATRGGDGVVLVAVSKAFSLEVVAAAIDAGVTDLGENRAQELAEKAAAVERPVRWHFVGHLQTNKVRHVTGTAALIHSVDRTGAAEAIARRARSLGVVQDVLIEVNVAGERAKQGVELAGAVVLARKVAALDGVTLRGVMTIPPRPRLPEDSREHFRRLAVLRDEIRAEIPTAAELSMGMTRDFEVAIEEGATIVRIGEAIFGPRGP